MTYFDVFNGDADGICSLLQWRLAHPVDSVLITGVKRDIVLLEHVDPAKDDHITVLDISLDKNRAALQKCLSLEAKVMYVDHHYAGDIPSHPLLDVHINTAADVCTSLLVNGLLKSRYSGWAIVGAYGDNLFVSAEALASSHGYSAETLERLKLLGTYINYNAYGATLADLHIAPADLYKSLQPFNDPLHFLEDNSAVFDILSSGYQSDMANASNAEIILDSLQTQAVQLPNAAWSRRVSGVYGNALANAAPGRAHAILTELDDEAFLVSVRAPLSNKHGADELCRQFDTGGGRAAAAGINYLPKSDVERFLGTFADQFSTS